MITLKDVARKAKVSVSTVSYVINKKKIVKAETYKRIIDAIEELKYMPNLAARGLKTKKSGTIGIIVPDISNLFFVDVVHGIEVKAHKLGYSIILCNTENNLKLEEEYLDILISKNIDGLVFISTGNSSNLLKMEIDLPIIVFDRKIGEKFTSICLDNEKGGYLATKHLLEKGKKEIALISGPTSLSTFFERVSGYKNALREARINYTEKLFIETEISYKGGYEATQTLLDTDVFFDAIFASNDLIAIGSMRALYERGLKVPQDVAIVGYDDIRIAGMFIPALTSIRQPRFEMGMKIAEVMSDKISNMKSEIQMIVFEPNLIVRETT